MISNSPLLFAIALFFVLLMFLVGIMVSILLNSWSPISKLSKKMKFYIHTFSTLLITTLITLLVFWLNSGFVGKVGWFTEQAKNNNPAIDSPANTLSDS